MGLFSFLGFEDAEEEIKDPDLPPVQPDKDDPRDHDHGWTEEEHRRANRDTRTFFRSQAQGTVTIKEGKSEHGDVVAGKPAQYDNEPRIYGMTYDEYADLTAGERADLRHKHNNNGNNKLW